MHAGKGYFKNENSHFAKFVSRYPQLCMPFCAKLSGVPRIAVLNLAVSFACGDGKGDCHVAFYLLQTSLSYPCAPHTFEISAFTKFQMNGGRKMSRKRTKPEDIRNSDHYFNRYIAKEAVHIRGEQQERSSHYNVFQGMLLSVYK